MTSYPHRYTATASAVSESDVSLERSAATKSLGIGHVWVTEDNRTAVGEKPRAAGNEHIRRDQVGDVGVHGIRLAITQ
jgi:hypothetical protein